jgi:hypothetical protein
MASTLTRIRDEVKALVDASYGADIPMPFGRLERNAQSAPPRVAWEPGEGAEAPATKNGTTPNPRSLGTVLQRMNLQVWAADFDAAWTLLMQVRRAIYLAAQGSFAFRGHSPLSEGDLAAYELEGHAWALRVDFAIPITDATVPEATVTTVGHTSGVEGSVTAGCSS